MKKQKTVSPATAPAVESAPAPQVSETTAQRDSANRKVSIPPELTKPNERRAFALAYRRTLNGRKLDFMPGALIPALCKGIAAAVFHAERIARETGIAAEALAAALTGSTPEEPNRAALLDAGAQIDG